MSIYTSIGLRTHISPPIHKVTVIATDHGKPRLSSSVLLNLTVLDTNDHRPQLLFYETDAHLLDHARLQSGRVGLGNLFAITENLPANNYIGDVLAKDDDIGQNAQLQFELVNDMLTQYSTRFRLLRNGSLYTTVALDREEKIRVRDPDGEAVNGQIQCWEPAHLKRHQVLSFLPDPSTNPLATVYDLITRVVLDREAVTESGPGLLFVYLVCSDGYGLAEGKSLLTSRHTATMTATLSVRDDNDHRPTFSQSIYHVTISENNPIGEKVIQVSLFQSIFPTSS
ncbi:hypothetical protein AHF37_09736 [Paragonimus kellicotti]|nr:hypothetical protein AHF37_09736 [Paragonimus kellicotti]